MKRISAFLLALALALGIYGCGESRDTSFRVLDTVGVRHYGLIYRLDDRLAPQVDQAMKTLAARGELSAISVRWLGQDVITLKASRSDRAAQAEADKAREEAEEPPAEEVEALPTQLEAPEEAEEASRRLIVGVEAEFQPMAFLENGVQRGMSIDIADALGRVLGWEVSYQPIAPAEVEAQLSSGNIDCALGFDPAAVRADRYTTGVSYMDSDVVVAVRPDSKVHRMRDVKGQRIGTISDPVIAAILAGNDKVTRYASGATVYLSPTRCVRALDNGWCAAIAVDRLMLQHLT